ncbi:MAG: glucosaminidase domain-containing protein [Chitinophagaceae bacterium]
MRNTRIFFLLVLLAATSVARAQDDQTIRIYIETYKDLAIAEMQRTGVPASITLAQGIHETSAGTSDLVLASNNHFGIKCKTGWTGESVTHDDDFRGECFRKYKQPGDSYKDHSDFLKNGNRYAFLFSFDALDYEDWANGLKKAGYATNPKYPQIIIRLIQQYHLQDYSLIALGKLAPEDAYWAKNPLPPGIMQPVAVVATNTEDSTAQTAAINPVVEEEKPSFPPGEFRINDTRVIYAVKGTSFLSIAQQYQVPLARVFEFNDMTEKEAVEKDQLIYLQRKRRTGNNEIHIVKTGETLDAIAQTEAIRIESLLEYNNLGRNSRLTAGDQLYLRQKAPANAKRRSIE